MHRQTINGEWQGPAEGPGKDLAPEAYRALYDHSPDGVLFTAPDGRVLAANPAACAILGLSEAEICARGRRGLSDPNDARWAGMVADRDRNGRGQGIARMVRGDGDLIEVEMSAQIFTQSDGARRTCTVIRDVTERLRMEQELIDMSARLRDMTLTDELTELRNRRGFVTIGAQLLEVADRQEALASLLFLDVDNLKELNDRYGHPAGDSGLRAVARALRQALRRADVAARIGGDEFVALGVGLDETGRDAVELRIRESLCAESTVAAVGRAIEVSVGWALRGPGEPCSVEDLLADADRAMYRVKASKAAARAG